MFRSAGSGHSLAPSRAQLNSAEIRRKEECEGAEIALQRNLLSHPSPFLGTARRLVSSSHFRFHAAEGVQGAVPKTRAAAGQHPKEETPAKLAGGVERKPSGGKLVREEIAQHHADDDRQQVYANHAHVFTNARLFRRQIIRSFGKP